MNQETLEQEQLRLAKLGIEAESFKSSAVGKYLESKADELIAVQTQKLILCDPSDYECNVNARNGIQIGALFKQWIDDAIQEGLVAREDIRLSEDESLS